MTTKSRKIAAVVGSIAATLSLSFLAVMPAVAAAPQDAHITLISPILNATNTSEAAVNQKMADGWVSNGWFGEGLIYQRAFVPVGSTVNMTYHVTDKDGKPLVGQDVKLRINKGYSTSTSILQVDNAVTKGVDKPPLDQANVVHKTDSYGNVTFAVQNLDKAPLGEPEPDSMTSKPNTTEDGLNDLHSQMLPEIAGEKPDHSVITEFHYYIPKSSAVVPATHPTIRLVSPVLTDANSIHREDLEKLFSVDNTWYAKGITFRHAYVPTGGSMNLVYKVTGDNGAPLLNTKVKLHVNKAYSKSNAKLTDGKTATDPAKDSSQGNDQALLEGTTDGFGYVVFSLKNTDTKGEAMAATVAKDVNNDPTKGAVFSQLWPEVAGGADIADMTEFHFFGAATSAAGSKIAVTTSAKKTGSKYVLTVAIANASGKTAMVAVTGLKAKTEKVTVANQAFAYTVTAGAKTVTVTIDGKAYTSKVTVK